MNKVFKLKTFQECNIEFEEVAKTEIIHVCTTKAERNCSITGDNVCSIIFETGEQLARLEVERSEVKRSNREIETFFGMATSVIGSKVF
jgi:hypothetical protein